MVSGIAAQGLVSQSGDCAVGKGALELARGHRFYAFTGERQHGIGGGEILDCCGRGMCVMGTTQLALIATHHPVSNYFVGPIRQMFVMILDK